MMDMKQVDGQQDASRSPSLRRICSVVGRYQVQGFGVRESNSK
jgi:hypothetical protein